MFLTMSAALNTKHIPPSLNLKPHAATPIRGDLLVNGSSFRGDIILRLCLVAHLADHVLSQHRLGLGAVDGVELLCGVLATHHENGLRPSWVLLQELGAVIHLVVVHKPDRRPAVVLLNLHCMAGKLVLDTCWVLHLRSGDAGVISYLLALCSKTLARLQDLAQW